jgi:hypothetical protein
MSDFQNEMNRTVQGFVAQITELARRAAINTLESAFGERAARGSSSSTAVAAVAASSGRVGRPRGGRGAKLTAADLEALSERVATFVRRPGPADRADQQGAGDETKDLRCRSAS